MFNWEDSKLEDEIKNRKIEEDKLKDICLKYDIPSNLRGEIWSILLGTYTDSVKFEKDLQLDKDKDISEILTLYYNETTEKPNPNHNKILEQIMKFSITKEQKYHLFYQMVKNYLPIMDLRCFSLLFRLCLLYHDPTLCLHFDQNRIEPEDYCKPWIENIFLELTDDIIYLWDLFLCREPIFPVFYAIALLKKKRDFLLSSDKLDLKIADKLEIVSILKLAQEIQKETPVATKNQVMSVFYPTKETNLVELHKFYLENVILPLPISEIIEIFKKDKKSISKSSLHYIVIDCRSIDSFKFARLPTAIHIGTNIRYDEKRMNEIIKQYESAKGSHFTIFGTGRQIQDELNLLKLIAMKFIQNGFPHVSITTDGFKGCIKYITSNQIEYVQDEKKEEEQETDYGITSTISSLSTNLFGWGKKQIENLKKEEIVSQPTFSLDDDELAYNSPQEEQNMEDVEREIKMEYLNKIDTNISIFKGNEPGNELAVRYIVIGDNMVLSLKSHSTKLGYGIIVWKRLITHLLKLSFKKENKSYLTLFIKGKPDTLSGDDEGEFKYSIIIPESMNLIELIQKNLANLKK